MALGSHFGPFLMLKWSQVGTNIGTKTDLNLKRRISTKYCKTNDFFDILGVGASILRAPDTPKWPSKSELGGKMGPRSAYRTPKRTKGQTKTPTSARRSPRKGPRSPQGPPNTKMVRFGVSAGGRRNRTETPGAPLPLPLGRASSASPSPSRVLDS